MIGLKKIQLLLLLITFFALTTVNKTVFAQSYDKYDLCFKPTSMFYVDMTERGSTNTSLVNGIIMNLFSEESHSLCFQKIDTLNVARYKVWYRKLSEETYTLVNSNFSDTNIVSISNSDYSKLEDKPSQQSKRLAGLTKINFYANFVDSTNCWRFIDADSIFNKYLESEKINRALVAMTLDKAYGPNGYLYDIERLFTLLPVKPVSIGDTWHANLMNHVGIDFKSSSTCRLDSVIDNIAFIAVNSDLKADSSMNDVVYKGMRNITLMTGSQKGILKVDIDTGLIKSAIFENKLTGSMQTVYAESGEVVNLPQPTKGTSRFEFKVVTLEETDSN